MKRRTNPQRGSRLVTPLAKRPLRPQSGPDFGKLLYAHVEAHCPEHFSERDGQRAVLPAGIISYLETIIRDGGREEAQAAREGIHNIQEIVRFRESQGLV